MQASTRYISMEFASVYPCTLHGRSVQVTEALTEYSSISAMCVGLVTSMPEGTGLAYGQ